MKDPVDITNRIPLKYRERMNRNRPVLMTPKAFGEVMAAAFSLDVEDQDVVLNAVADSLGGFVTSDYFVASPWFRKTHRHTFTALRFQKGELTVEPVLIYNLDDNTVYGRHEISLPDGYLDSRIVEETKVESFPDTHVF